MDRLDGNNRQSGINSIINRERTEHFNTDRPYPTSTMAATAVVSPTSSIYTQPPPPYSSGWSGPAVSGLISPPDSRRTSDNKQELPAPMQSSQPQRQSLPSIHEALNSGPKPNPYSSPISASQPPSHQIPYTQGPPIPRSYPPADHSQYPSTQLPPAQSRQPSPPHPVHPQTVPFSRPETNAFEFPRHPPLSALQAPPAPPNPYAAPRHEPARYEQDPRAQGRAPVGYPQYPHPQQTYGPGPGAMPPSRQHPPAFNQPQYDQRDPRDVHEPGKWARDEKQEPPIHSFRQGLKRNLEVWDFENNLAQINFASSAISQWSAHYNAIAQEQQQSSNVIPDRMPTIESIDEMIGHQAKLAEHLQEMKAIVYEQAAHSNAQQRMREQGGRGSGDYDEDVGMYGDDMKNHGYGSEGKKRRGRAAPPGRCHSCNRAETPEWRRGPDGARTLCNACGLHYAKLTRKNTMKNSQGSNGSNLRPKSMEDLSPRPM